MKQRITGVSADSPAEKCGIRKGWSLIAIDGNPVYDVIDYEQLTTGCLLTLTLETENEGDVIERRVRKEMYEPLGLDFESSLMSPVRQCANHCVFCFIDQMPHGNRGTLYFRDDDWRLSLIMGNYVTLTNVSDAEFDRIIRRRVSPLYISVHATDGAIRKTMMRGKNAENIMTRLRALHDAGLGFHCQIVLCPGYNDGIVLQNTLEDLFNLRPECASVAVVPVGLTRHRTGLTDLQSVTADIARGTIEQIREFKRIHGIDDFVYASDEMYLRAGLSLPAYEECGEFEQIENGVGLFRRFENGFRDALSEGEGELKPLNSPLRLDSVSGVSIAPIMQTLFNELRPYNIEICVHAVRNDFFGPSVTVSGLTTARDIVSQLAGKLGGRALILPHTMLRENDVVFLDGMTMQELSEKLAMPVFKVSADDGYDFILDLVKIAGGMER